MSEFLRNWLTVAVIGGVGVLLASVFLGLGSLVRPSRDTPQKGMNYESGVDPQGDMWRPGQYPLLRVRPNVRALRRRGRVHLSVGGPAGVLRDVRPCKRWPSSLPSWP